jgi:hypothetical protein
MYYFLCESIAAVNFFYTVCQQEVITALGVTWKIDVGSKSSPVLKAWIGFVKLSALSKN